MRFTRNGVQLIAGAIVGATALVVACGGDDDSTGTTSGSSSGTTTSSGGSSGTTTSSGGSSGTTSSSGTTTSSSGSTSGDAGNDAAGDGGAGNVANGGSCNADGECKSGHCFQQDYCTVTCTMKGQTDAVCQGLGGDFTGKCNKQGLCQKN